MRDRNMNFNSMLLRAGFTAILAVVAGGIAISAQQDKYTLKIPGGLSFAEFKGYEKWEVIAVSHNGDLLAAIMGNPVTIDAFKSGIPGNGRAFPDGAKMAKVHWKAKQAESQPGQPTVPDFQQDVDFM